MFCPGCATENSSQQRYCRRCGLPLLGARLCLEGRTDEALARIKKGVNMLSGALTALAIFIPVVFVVLLSMGKLNLINFALNMFIVFAVALPFVVSGLIRFRRAERLLNPSGEFHDPAIIGSKNTKSLSEPASFAAQAIPPEQPLHISATEHTTFDLKSSSRRGA